MMTLPWRWNISVMALVMETYKMEKELVKFRTSTKFEHDVIAVGGEDSGPGVAPIESCKSYAR